MDSPNNNVVDDQDQVQLPGFRFHPTDEELVGFYLRRKVDMKPISFKLIKPIDIYKYDPWDLPKSSCTSGDKEWYFFCKRGRKYKNSIRPNRVTGSGFWKATGIDKPVHSLLGNNNNNNINKNHNNNNHCIGLKKTLVYYRGSAGKGTKTDWMMHEFRLPTSTTNNNSEKIDTLREAEIWTLCRIFKRNVSYRKYTSDCRELSTKRSQPNMDTNYNKKCNSMESNNYIKPKSNNNYIDFSAPLICHEEKKPAINHITINNNNNGNHDHHSTTNHQVLQHVSQLSSVDTVQGAISSNIDCPILPSFQSIWPDENDQLLGGYTNWDELRAVVEYALDS